MSLERKKIYIIAGEASGDQLGASLITELAGNRQYQFDVMGIGGQEMMAAGLNVSLFPMSDLSIMGITAVLKRLPLLLRRIRQTIADIENVEPDVLVLIDSPDFTHRVARKVRQSNPGIKIINYVSPTVWAWRPGRARRMKSYIDLVLGVLPFEPEVYKKLDGPDCIYVGHPLLQISKKYKKCLSSQEMANVKQEMANVKQEMTDVSDMQSLLLLPGSRRGEIKRHMPIFKKTIVQLYERGISFDLSLVIAPGHRHDILNFIEDWPQKPQLIEGAEAKWSAMHHATIALAASGTVSLELALAKVPMVVIYKTDQLLKVLRFLAQVDTMVLPNLILGRKFIPEYLNSGIDISALAQDLADISQDGMKREQQMDGFDSLEKRMQLPDGQSSSSAVLEQIIAQIKS